MKFRFTGLGIRRARATLATFGVILLAACTIAAQASPYVMFRDPQCGCCEEWAKHVRTGLDHEERPDGVAGIAVAGMPLGSPGMEVGERVQPYQVIAFGPAGESVFASYP